MIHKSRTNTTPKYLMTIPYDRNLVKRLFDYHLSMLEQMANQVPEHIIQRQMARYQKLYVQTT